MVDFLTKLAERTQGRTAVVQPLIQPWVTPTPIDQTVSSPETAAHDEQAPPATSAPLGSLDEFTIQSVTRKSTRSVPERADTQSDASKLQPRAAESSGTQLQPPPPIVEQSQRPRATFASGSLRELESPPSDLIPRTSLAKPRDAPSTGNEPVRIEPGASAAKPTDQIAPVLADQPDDPVHTPINVAASRTAPMPQPMIDQEQVVIAGDAVDSRGTRSIESHSLSTTSTNVDLTRSPATILQSTPCQPLVPMIIRQNRAGSDLSEQPEAIVAPEHTMSQPVMLPAQLAERNAARPTVKVTIGRIEVRAAPPAPTQTATQPPQPRKPVLSLQDYLKRRNGGSR